MIIAKGEADGRPFIVFGLSHENIANLLAGQPIYHKNHPALGGDGLLIVAGTTEQEIEQVFKDVGAVSDLTTIFRDNSIRDHGAP